MDVSMVATGCHRDAAGNIANAGGFGTVSKGATVNTEGFGTCRFRDFRGAGNTDGTGIFGS